MGVGAAVGAGVAVYGQLQASQARRSAERANANFLREQAVLDDIATERELDIFDRESDLLIGDNISLIAKSGVDLSGSLLTQVAFDKQQLQAERQGIALTGERRVALSEMKARQTDKYAKDIGYASQLQAFGSMLNIGSSYAQAAQVPKPKPGGNMGAGGG